MEEEGFEKKRERARSIMRQWEEEDAAMAAKNPDYILQCARARRAVKRQLLEALPKIDHEAKVRTYVYYQATPWWLYNESWKGPTVITIATKEGMMWVLQELLQRVCPERVGEVTYNSLDSALDNSPHTLCACFTVRRLRSTAFLSEIQNAKQRDRAVDKILNALVERFNNFNRL